MNKPLQPSTLESFTCRVRIFGEFSILVNNSPPPKLCNKTNIELLAYLILHHDQDVERDSLAKMFWPDATSVMTPSKRAKDPTRPKVRLVECLSRLKGYLNVEGEEPRLITTKKTIQKVKQNTVRFVMQAVEADLTVWENTLAGPVIDLVDAEMMNRVERLLAGWDDEWITTKWMPNERNRLTIDYLESLDSRSSVAINNEERADAKLCFERIYQLDPWHSNCFEKWLSLLYYEDRGFGKMNELLTDYKIKCKAARRQSGTVFDHYDGLRKEGIKESNSSNRGSLIVCDEIIGRSIELELIRESLRYGRLTSLTGPSGIGKTRLAIVAGNKLWEEFRDRVWYINFAGDETYIASKIYDVVWPTSKNTQGSKQEIDIGVLVEKLVNRRALLILDNCELVLESVPSAISEILRKCREIKIITTSRTPLEFDSRSPVIATHLRVPPLEYPGGTNQGKRALTGRFSAVNLLIDRASQPNARFVIDQLNVDTVVEICRLLEGIPQAIELVAAQLRFHPILDIYDSLQVRIRSQERVDNHDTLREFDEKIHAALDVSYERLTSEQRMLSCCCAAFDGGWTLEAAQVVSRGLCGEDTKISDLLAELSNRSLIEYTEYVAMPARYRFLTTTRMYSLWQLEKLSAADVIRTRHQNYYLELIAGMGSLQAEANSNENRKIERIEAELPNFRIATDYGRSTGSIHSQIVSLRLAVLLGEYYELSRHFSEGYVYVQRALEPFESAVDSMSAANLQDDSTLVLIASAHLMAGILAKCRRDFDDAERSLEKATTGFEAQSSVEATDGLLRAKKYLANCKQLRGLYPDARNNYKGLYAEQQNFDHELEMRLQSVKEEEEKDTLKKLRSANRENRGWTLIDLGRTSLLLDSLIEAHGYYEQALRFATSIEPKLPNLEAQSLKGIGDCNRCNGDYNQSLKYYTMTLLKHLGSKDRASTALTLIDMGFIRFYQKEYMKARLYFNRSIRRSQSDDLFATFNAEIGLGRVALAQQKSAIAVKSYRRCIEIVKSEVASPQEKAMLIEAVAELATSLKRDAAAATLWGQADKLRGAPGFSPIPRNEQSYYLESINATRSKLTPGKFHDAWTGGARIEWEPALELASKEVLDFDESNLAVPDLEDTSTMSELSI